MRSPSNADIAELLSLRAAEAPDVHRARAYRRAAAAALSWELEAAEVLAAGLPLRSLQGLGERLAARVEAWLRDPPEVPEPPPERAGFATMAEAVAGVEPAWRGVLRGDLQIHTVASDGKQSAAEVAEAAAAAGYSYVAITDHSHGLPVAHGLDERRLAEQGDELAALNATLGDGAPTLLHGVEMNLDEHGRGDLDAGTLRRLDIVLGAFHSKLRERNDATPRYLAALDNPYVDVLAHPRCRRYGLRVGLSADWEAVCAAAAAASIALEVDASVMRQDLDVGVLEIAARHGTPISVGTDAHSVHELTFAPLALLALQRAGVAPDRVINTWPLQRLQEWVASHRRRARAAP